MNRLPWLLRADRILIVIFLFLASLICGILLRRSQPAHNHPKLLAAFLNVGSGDCTLLRTVDGQAVLVDTGPAAAEPLVVKTMQRQGIRSLALLVIASPSQASSGGVSALIASGIGIKQIWVYPGFAIKKATLESGIPIRVAHQGDVFPWSGATLSVLWPPADKKSSGGEALVCAVQNQSTDILLAAPAGASEVAHLVAGLGSGLSCHILEVAEGGADGATTPELLRRAAPTVAVISCSSQKPPSEITLHHLEAAGAAVWRTDIQGAISVYTEDRAPPVVTAAHI